MAACRVYGITGYSVDRGCIVPLDLQTVTRSLYCSHLTKTEGYLRSVGSRSLLTRRYLALLLYTWISLMSSELLC